MGRGRLLRALPNLPRLPLGRGASGCPTRRPPWGAFWRATGHAATYVAARLWLSGQPPVPHPHVPMRGVSERVQWLRRGGVGSALAVVVRACLHGGISDCCLSFRLRTMPPSVLLSGHSVKMVRRWCRPEASKGQTGFWPRAGLPHRIRRAHGAPRAGRLPATRMRGGGCAVASPSGGEGGGEAEREPLDVCAAAATHWAAHGGIAPPQPPSRSTVRATGGGGRAPRATRMPAGSSTIRRVS